MNALDRISSPRQTEPPLPSSSFLRHRGPVTGVCAIPGSSKVVTSAYDSAVALFDLETGEVDLLGYHEHLVNRIVVDARGERAASCSSDYTVCIWDLEKREPIRILQGHSDDVEDFVFIEGSWGASASRDRRILVWDLDTGAILRVLDGHEKDVLSLAYHDGTLYSSGDDSTLRAWDLESGKQINLWGPFETETDTCAMDPLHGRVVLGCDDGFVRVFDVGSGRLLGEVAGHSSGIKKVAVSPVNGDILSAAYDQNILFWDPESLTRKQTLQKHPATWERSLTWSPEGDRILAGTFDGTVLVWDAGTGALLSQVGDQTREPGNACLNEVGAAEDGTVVLVSDDGFVRLARFTAGGGEWLEQVEPASGRILMNAVTLDADAGLVVAGAHNHKVHLFDVDLARGTLGGEREVVLGQGPVNTIRVCRHPEYRDQAFVGCYSSAIVRVTREGEIAGTIRVHEGAVKALRLHPQQTVGVSCGADGLLLSWSFEGELLQRFLGHTAIINDVDLEPSGERIASVSRDFSVKIYELATGKLLETFALGHKSLKSVCFFDADTIVVGDYWGSLIRVDLASGGVRREKIAANGVSAVGRCGDHVAATSYDGGVYRVSPRDLSVVDSLRAMHQRVL
jgi:WD40 repeat protein